MRRCARCKEDKPLDQFRIIQSKGGRISSYCQLCEKTYNSAYNLKVNHNLLYVITYGIVDYCKIGVTINPNARLRELRCVWPFADFAAVYEVRCAKDIESGLLKLFENVRVGTYEVLSTPADRVISMIDSMADVLGVTKVELVPEERQK